MNTTPIPDTPIPRRILVFEPLSGGHRAEFLAHLLNHCAEDAGSSRSYIFVVGEPLSGVEVPPNVEFDPLNDADKERLAKAMHSSVGSFDFMRVLRRAIDKWNPDRLILMDLTYLELALCFRRLPCKASAILFVQYPELRSLSVSSVKVRSKFVLKELKTRMLLANRNLERIWLLNGADSCAYLNKRFNTSRFHALPDPVPGIYAETGFDIRRDFGIEPSQRIFLCFGSMSPRKGVGQLVAALEQLPNRVASHSVFLFCGKPELGFEGRYRSMLKKLKEKRPDIQLFIDERFVEDRRMRAIFEQVDWILIPYTRPEYSSGILAHAAAARTPVIGCRDGLVGRQIRDFSLGLVASVDPDGLGHALETASESKFRFNEDARRTFVENSSPERFATMVLEV